MSELGHRAADALTNAQPDATYIAQRWASRRAVYGDVVRPRDASLTDLYRSLGVPNGTGPELTQVAAVRDAPGRGGSAGAHRLEHRGPPPGGWVPSCAAQVERAEDGAPRRLIGAVNDATALRMAEERGRQAGQRFADLAAAVPAAVAVVDPAGRLVDGNERLCGLLGQPLTELRGRPLAELASAPGAALWLRPAEPGAAPAYQVGTVQLRRPDGRSSCCELSVTPMVGDDGRRGWLLVFSELLPAGATTGRALSAPVTLDELTGLPNRAAAVELVSHLLAGRRRPRVAVLCAGVDGLRRVNDSLGHEAGDELLHKLADLLRSELPAGCTAARLAADEFVIVCSDVVELGGPEAVASRIRGVLRTTLSLRGQPVAISACVGAAGPPAEDSTAADLLRFADAAMYRAKRLGPGRTALADEATATGASVQLRVEAELRRAIAADQLVLHYQPVVGADGAVRTAEALVRWVHPARGLVGPDEFLPAAARADLLHELDRWVLRTATREAAGWPEHCGYPVSVAVNLAGLLPAEPDFLAAITDAVTEAGLPWSRLVLELVETSLVELPASAVAVMDELVARGVRFAVDDFGTGYSSLGRLKTLPVQIVKVDRAFVAGVSRDPADFAVARAVVEVARAMGRRCVAEGVETVDQLHVLRGIGVDAFQGYLFARPVDVTALREILGGDRLGTPLG